MPTLDKHHNHHPANALSPEQIQQILVRVEENLRQDPIYRKPASIAAHSAAEGPKSSAVISELHRLLKELYSMQAPLFVVKGRDFPNQLKWVLNLPIRLFGSKQARFNNELLEMLELIVAQSHLISTLIEEVENLQHAVAQLDEQLAKHAESDIHLSQQQCQTLKKLGQSPLETD